MTCTPEYGYFEEHATGTVQIIPSTRARTGDDFASGDGGAAATLL